MKFLVCIFLVFQLSGILGAQNGTEEPGSGDPLFSLDVKVVNVLATVKDSNGHLLSTLGKEDFILEEDGVRQQIKYFSHQTDLPLTLGLLIDTSGSQQALIPEERRAGELFFQSVLRPKTDLAFLMSFDRNVELLQDYTDSINLLQRGMDELRVEGAVGGLHPNPTGRQKQTSTALYDAVYLAADEMFDNQIGRKAIVIISDGHDFGSKTNLKTAIEAAQRADLVIFSILYIDQFFAAGGYFNVMAGPGALKRLSTETGGSFFRVGRSNPLSSIFDQINKEMRSQYSLGYSPKKDLTDPGFRKLKLKSPRKGIRIQARNGYYADAI